LFPPLPGTAGSKPVVIRAAGPSLAAFGVTNPLPDPYLKFFAGAAKLGENDDWGGGANLVAAIGRVGAFPFISSLSKDAAVVALVAKGDNSIRLSTGSRGLERSSPKSTTALPRPTTRPRRHA
jgi:hypothetical protein